MARTSIFKLPANDEPIVDALTNGAYWVLDGTRTVTWAVADAPGIDWKWNPYGAAMMRDAMSSVLSKYAEVANIRFEYVGWFDDQRTAPADIVLAATLFPANLWMPSSVYAWAYFPYEPETDAQIAGMFGSSEAYPNASGDVILNYSNYEISNSTFTPGSNGYFALLHEVGHAVGLKHPHDNGGTLGRPTFEEIGFNDADNQILTIMSYDPATSLAVWFQRFGLPTRAGYPESLMPLDILALQSIYGPNMTTRAGSDVYELYNDESIETFWDAGGEDVVTAYDSFFGWNIFAVSTSEFENLVVAIPDDWNTNTGKFFFNIEDFVGSEYNDSIIATPAANLIGGLGGNDNLAGLGGDDTIFGGLGLDIADYIWSMAAHTVYRQSNGWIVESGSGVSGIDTLIDVERVRFTDVSVALDLSGNAGTVAKILGAVFGREAVFNEEYAGIGLYYIDGGMSYESLMQLAIDARLGPGASHQAVVDLLYTNVVGVPPGDTDRAYFVGLLDTNVYTVASLGVMAADIDLNLVNIDLVGLAQQGLEYAPYEGG